LPEVDQIDKCKGYLIGTTNQLFLNFGKLKADMIVDLDKLTWTCPESKNKTDTEQAQRQKLIRTHTVFEKKIFKHEPRPDRPKHETEQTPNKDFQNFNFKQADKEDVLGLMYRNDEAENKLRMDVLRYL
jgi:hypothetical protein